MRKSPNKLLSPPTFSSLLSNHHHHGRRHAQKPTGQEVSGFRQAVRGMSDKDPANKAEERLHAETGRH